MNLDFKMGIGYNEFMTMFYTFKLPKLIVKRSLKASVMQ